MFKVENASRVPKVKFSILHHTNVNKLNVILHHFGIQQLRPVKSALKVLTTIHLLLYALVAHQDSNLCLKNTAACV